MSEETILELLVKVIESNTTAMEKSAEASEKMSKEVKGLRVVITGAQRKIGGELGPIIARQKIAEKELADEVARVRKIGADVAS